MYDWFQSFFSSFNLYDALEVKNESSSSEQNHFNHKGNNIVENNVDSSFKKKNISKNKDDNIISKLNFSFISENINLFEKSSSKASIAYHKHISSKEQLKTPGNIRSDVLSWIYSEKSDNDCPALCVSNSEILLDLISVFVCVILHGKSDYIRQKLWQFLIDGSIHSLHFAVIVICNLNSNVSQPKKNQESQSDKQFLQKRVEDLDMIQKAITIIENDRKNRVENSNEKNVVQECSRDNLSKAVNILESVYDNQILANHFMTQERRTSRKNIDLLISKLRTSISQHSSEKEKNKLRKLDERLGFIKTLTDLNEHLRCNIEPVKRREILIDQLKKISYALPSDAYFPTAVAQISKNHRIKRIIVEKTIVFNTAKNCPFLLFAEMESPESSLNNFSDIEKNLNENVESHINSLKKHFMTNNSENDQNLIKSNDSLQDEIKDHFSNDLPNLNQSNRFIVSMIVKSGDDLRQQQLGVLFVTMFQKIFLEEKVHVWLAPYKVLATGYMSGLLEPSPNADSISRIKEKGGYNGIDDYFVKKFGPKNSRVYKLAQQNFMRSLAGYSIVAYLIKLHDRHNGNILIDNHGHFIHIDFSFMLGNSHSLEFSPFKLTVDMMNILDGPDSSIFRKFRELMKSAFLAAHKHYRELTLVTELLSIDQSSICFAGGQRWVVDEFKTRFCPGFSTRQLRAHIDTIINQSVENYSTRWYDRYQRCVNGIL